MVAATHDPNPSTPPDPAAIPRLQPLPPEDARLLNAFLFTHNQDHSAAAAAFSMLEVELMLFLDQPHITPYLQRFAANRRDQRTDRAAAKLDELINRTTNDIELRRAITALFRFYQTPRVTRPPAIKISPEDPRPDPAPPADSDRPGPASRTSDTSPSSRALRIGTESPRTHQAPAANPDALDARFNTGTTVQPKADPAAPAAAGPQIAASPTRDHETTRPHDHSPTDHTSRDHALIDNLTPLMPTDPAERTLWLKRVADKRCRWTRADQRQFEADVKAALAQAYADAREDGIDLEANPNGAYLYTNSYIHRLRDDKPP